VEFGSGNNEMITLACVKIQSMLQPMAEPGASHNGYKRSRIRHWHPTSDRTRPVANRPIRGRLDWRCGLLRRGGGSRTLKKHGIPEGPSIVGEWSAKGGCITAEELVRRHPKKFTAISTGNDQMALGVLDVPATPSANRMKTEARWKSRYLQVCRRCR
jgi:hypothetical protein